MPDPTAAARVREQIQPLLVVCVLAIASLVIAFLGATPARVSATELLGAARHPGDVAFIASHRGGGEVAPENTLPAISAALAGGDGYVEVDVALTADRVPVLMHDVTVDRTTNGTGALAALSAAEVRGLDAGAWFGPEFVGTAVPTLTEFLDTLDTLGGRAILELKGEWDAASIEVAVGEIIARDLERQIAVASFDARTLAAVSTATDVISRLLILKNIPDDVTRATDEADVPGIVVSGDAVLERPEIVEELRAHGVRTVVYTLNKDAQWESVTELGVDGIVTDDPAALSAWQSAYAATR